MPETETYGKILRDHNPTYLYPKRIHHHRPQTVGGFKKCFEEQGQRHETALRNPIQYTVWGKNGMRPPATKGNKKSDKLGDKLGDKGRKAFWKADTPSNTKTKANTVR